MIDAAPARALAAWLDALEAAGALTPTDVETCRVEAALDRIAAHDVQARQPHPPHRCAAMDGIAVRAADTAGAPVVLAPGSFAPIDTGQHVEARWDAVVPLEELELRERRAHVRHAAEPGRHVRPAGEDVAASETIVAAGRRLTPSDLGLVVACGHAALPIRARPRVALIPTGDEVRSPGSDLLPGEIHDANGVMLAASLRAAGALPEVLPISPDRPEALERAVRGATAASRLVLVLAGSSRGARDHTAAVLERCGAIVARGVALRPAHPVLLAVVGTTPVIGVPGYPVSAALACERFAEPVLARLSGTAPRAALRAGARLARPVLSRRDAEVVVPVVLERGPDGQTLAWPQSRRGGALAGLARADATLSVGPGAPPLDAGDHVFVELRR